MRQRDLTRLRRSLHKACRAWHQRASRLDALDLATAMGRSAENSRDAGCPEEGRHNCALSRAAEASDKQIAARALQGGHNGAAKLGDGLQLLRAVDALGTWAAPGQGSSIRPAPSSPTAPEMVMRIRGASAEVAACCQRARLPVEAMAPSVMALLVLAGRQLHGLQGTVWGKERRLTLRQLDTRSQQLERQLRRALPHLPVPIPLVVGGSETGFSASQPDELPLPEALPPLLSRFREGIARLLAETEVKAGGRPPVNDAILFGMEGLIAIWRQHHPLPGPLSAKAGGLLCFVEEALTIPQKANAVPADMQVPRSTLRAELTRLLPKAQGLPRAA